MRMELKSILMILIINHKMINHIYLLLMIFLDIIIIYHFHLFLLFKNFHLELNLKLNDLIYLNQLIPYFIDLFKSLFLHLNHQMLYH